MRLKAPFESAAALQQALDGAGKLYCVIEVALADLAGGMSLELLDAKIFPSNSGVTLQDPECWIDGCTPGEYKGSDGSIFLGVCGLVVAVE
jgi:hypothetical protein